MTESNKKYHLHRYAVPVLVTAGIVATVILYFSQSWTSDRIAANQAAHALRLVKEVLPAEGYDNEPINDVIMLSHPDLPGSSLPLPAFRARLGEQVIATAITAIAEDGYVGPIRLLIGFNQDGTIIGVRAIEHRETPGLGDKIETDKGDWIRSLEGKTPSEDQNAPEWRVRRDGGEINQISGATITSRAVLRAVRQTQRYYLANTATIVANTAADVPN